ncbi:MAG: hypothetical protein PVI79_09415, partial [Gammaproteobacteria bacterium]
VVIAEDGSIIIDADDETIIHADALGVSVSFSVSGGLAVSDAVVATIVDVDFDGTVLATIDDSIATASGDITVNADSIAKSYANAGAVAISVSISAGISGAFGVAAGEVYNYLGQTVEASIIDAMPAEPTDPGVEAGGKVDVKAKDNGLAESETNAIAVAAGFSLAGGGSIAVSAAVTKSELRGSTRARIGGSKVEALDGDVTVDARSLSNLETRSLAFSLSASFTGLSAAGAGVDAVNTINREVRAQIFDGSEVTASDAVFVTASDDGMSSSVDVDSAAVSLSFFSAGASVGVGLGKNLITSAVFASIEDSTVNSNGTYDDGTMTGGEITVDAQSMHAANDFDTHVNVESVSASLGGPTTSIAGASAVLDIENTVEAFVSGSALSATGIAKIDAQSQHTAKPEVVGFSGSFSLGGLAATVVKAETEISGATRAYIDGVSSVSSTGDLNVTADSYAKADPQGGSLTASLGVGLGVSDFDSRVTRETAAYVGTRANPPKVFDPAEAVNTGNNIISLGYHGWQTGDQVRYDYDADNDGSGANIGNLSNGSTYYVIDLGDGNLQLASSYANALAGSEINLSGAGTGDDHSLQLVTQPTATELNLGSKNLHVLSNAELISHADASSFGFALAASANSALSDSRVEGATLAYIGQGAVVNAGDVEIKATSTDTAKSINKVASVAGGVAIQIGRALADVNSRTEAFVGALSGDVAANITTGVNVGSHDIDVIANTSMEADASMLGGGFALGANVTSFQPEAQVDGATRAYVRDGVGINASTLDIKAGEADDNRATYLATADVDSIGFAFLLAASDLTADARVTGVVEAFAGASKDTVGGGDPSAQISLSNPSALQILAYADINAIADTDGGGGSLLASVQSLAPTATAGGFTRAFVNDGADLAGHDVRLLADGDARSDASLFNVSLSGLISVTNLKPVAQTTNISETFLGRSLETATGDAAEIHVGDVDADAKSKSIAFASSFGLSATAGVGINSVRAESLLLGGTRSYVGQNTTLYADNVDLRAEDLELDPLTDVITDNTHPAFGSALTGLASSYVANLSFAGIASISELESRALASRETMAFVGNDSALHLGTHSLTAVADTVLNTPMANASIDSANGAGLVAVTDLNATATIGAGTGQVSATRSYIGDNTNVTAGTVSLNAVSDTEAEATVDAIGAAGLVNVSATNIVATAAHDTQAYVGDGAMLTLSGGLNIFAGSHVTASPSSGGFSFGGALTYGSTDIKTVLDSDTDAYIGDEVMITAPTVTMRAAAEHVGAATSSKGSASLGIAIEDIETIVEDRGSVNVRIGAESGGVGTSITTDAGGVDVDAYLESQVKSESKAVSFALFGAVPLVTSVALNEAEATGHIGDNVSIDAQQGDFDMLVDLIGVARGASAATGAGGVAVTKTTLDVDFNAGVSLTVGEDADIAASSDTGNVNLKALLNHTGDKFLTQEDDIDNYDQDLDLNLDMVADNTDDWSNAEGELGAGAIGSANAVAGAIAAVNAADILVGADSTMVVEVGNNSSLHTGGTGGVNVSGLHSNTALGTMSSTAVGIAAINGDVNVTPSAFGSNTVTFNGDVIDDEGSAAQSLSVRGELSSIAEGTLSSTTGGVVTVDGGDVIARTFNNFDPDLTDSYDPDPKDDKYADLKVNFGNGNTDINVAENVNVTASLYTDADARTTSQSIGLVAVGDLDTKSISKGVVDLELGADQNVVAGGDINIKAGHAIGAERASDGTVVSSDDTSNLIDFGAPHNLSDGASIVFTGQDAVLENGRAYTIVKDGANTLHLGASFNGASVLTAYDTINFGFDHNLQNGDVVYYHDNGGTPIGTRIDGVAGSLVDGQAYEVFVVDSDSIKLQEIGQATPSVTVTRSAVGADGDSDDDTINVANSFVDGQVVTYHVPEPIPFSSQTVDANVVVNDGGTPDFPDDDTGSITNDGSNRIFLPNHGLYIGQAVRYTATGTPTIVVAGGDTGNDLNSGQIYYVAGGGAFHTSGNDGYYSDPNYIRLATTQDNATGYYWDHDGDGGDPDPTPEVWHAPVVLDLVQQTSDTASAVTHYIRALDDEPLSGLTNGRSYYVVNADSDSFQLSDTYGGPVKSFSTGSVASGGSHTFAVEGIDLISTGTGTQDLILDIGGDLDSNDSFSGIGGAVGFTGAATGDNTVAASTTGVSGGLVQASSSSSSASQQVTSNLGIGDGAELTASGDINVEIESTMSVSATSDGKGGGGIAIGAGNTSTIGVHSSLLSIGSDAKLNAGNDILVSADSNSEATGRAVTGSAGLGAGANSTSRVFLDYDVTTEVNGDLTAGNLLTIASNGDANGDAYAKADVPISVGAGANTYARVFIGDALAFNNVNELDELGYQGNEELALTRTDIKGNADLVANQVVIGAYVDRMRGNAYAETDVLAAGADCDADAKSYITSQNEVLLRNSSAITGNEKITIDSKYLKTHNYARSDADLDAVGGSTDSDADVNLYTRAKVEGYWEAVLTTADLDVNATQENFYSDASAARSGAWVDVGGRSESDGPKDARREIFWESHVILLGEPNPELEIAEDGEIITMTNINFLGINHGKEVGDYLDAFDSENPQVVIDDIIYDEAGNVTFFANDLSVAPAGVIWGNEGLVESQRTWDFVKIINDSEFDLVLNHIETHDGSAVVDIRVDDIKYDGDGDVAPESSQTANSIGDSFEFDLNLLYPQTLVEIRNRGTFDEEINPVDIILLGGISNTIGTTVIENQRNNIRVFEEDLRVNDTTAGKPSVDIPPIFDEGLIRTNKLYVDARGDIGNQTASQGRAPLAVELVRIDHTLSKDIAPALSEVDLEAESEFGDAVLDITLHDRSETTAPGADLSVTIDLITAGDDVDVVINDSKGGENN